MTAALSKREPSTLAGYAPMSADAVRAQVNLIQEVMREVMTEGEHFGKIPGCGDKPALLKAGAEKLGLTFRLIPAYRVERSELPNGHREYAVTCTLTTPAGEFVGEGVGCCSTMESKYRWRSADTFEVTDQRIPEDAKERKAEYRRQGYGMRKTDVGWAWVRFTGSGERQENPDIADAYNTVLKMAKKRAHVDAVLTATAASDIFTQDVDERMDEAAAVVTESSAAPPASKPPTKAAVSNPAPLDLIHKLHTVWLSRKGWKRVMQHYGLEFPAAFPEPKTDADLIAMQSWLTADVARFLSECWDETLKAAQALANAKRSERPPLKPGDENGDPEPELVGDARE